MAALRDERRGRYERLDLYANHKLSKHTGDLTGLASGYTVSMPEGIVTTGLATYFKLVDNNSAKWHAVDSRCAP